MGGLERGGRARRNPAGKIRERRPRIVEIDDNAGVLFVEKLQDEMQFDHGIPQFAQIHGAGVKTVLNYWQQDVGSAR